MRTPTSKRAVRLASALVAAGVTLTAAPHASAADDTPTAMTLTSKQADSLADRMGVDVYGDDAAAPGESTAEREDAPSADTSQPSASAGNGALPDDATAPVTFTQKSALEGVRGLGATVPAAGGNYFTVHSLGNVQLHKADGSTVWSRTNTSLHSDWQVKPLRVWQAEPYPARIQMGYNAVSPFQPYSDQGYDTGDLTGDGRADIVFSASVGSSPYRPFTSPGSSLTTGTFVTVLDGRTGSTVWSKLYSYATMVKVVDGTLLVADSPRLNQNAPATETATLTGLRFSAAEDGKLTPSTTWTYDTEQTGAVSWGALEDIGEGRAAVSWNRRKTSALAAHGHTFVLDTADGAVTWRADSELYGRQLRLDASRERIVALEQSDYSDGVTYQLASYDLAGGDRTTLDTRVNALPTAMAVGDAAVGGGAEYTVAESTLDPDGNINAGTIRVLSGEDGSTAKWTHTTKRDADNGRDGASVWGLAAANGSLVASAQDDRDMDRADNAGGLRYGSLTVFTPKGGIKWSQNGITASPMYQQVHRSAGTDFVRVIDQSQNIRTFKLGTGKATDLTPLRAELNYAQAVDLDGDKKKDVVAGGTSRGVWAWSGTSLVKGGPKQLWRADIPGEVHDIKTGDVNGDGKPEIVVAADTATVVLDGATGTVLTTIDAGGGEFVRSVTVADTDGDGKDEILVPTDALRVYNARGKQVWTYSAPENAGDVVFSDTVTGDGLIYTQYSSTNALGLDDAVENGVALDGRTGALKWVADPKAPASAPDGKLHGALLRNSVFASPEIPYADGHAVAYTWIASIAPSADAGTDLATPRVVIEIRDGRTGELLHQKIGGGPWSHDNYFIDGEKGSLYELSFGTLNGFHTGGVESRSSVLSPLRGVQFITGPGGRKLLGGGVEGGIGAWDPSVLDDGGLWQDKIGGATLMGAQNYLAADLDGDGVDEMVSLNHDKSGYDRMAQQLGSRVLSPDNAIHQMTVFTLS
ncbi:FG-GAP repeat domain-containing protein [Streptomyces sp. NPDC015140]|uniref:FG-GAP repeat domain-containing protein n=1 Tax=unclassified Streptomyces TaxID=2593676 RepID=UPI0036FAB036